MEGYIIQFQKLWQTRTTRLVMVMVTLVLAIVNFQNFALSLGTSSSSLSSIFRAQSPPSGLRNSTEVPHMAKRSNKSNETDRMGGGSGGSDFSDDDIDLGDDDETPDQEFLIDLGDGTVLKKAMNGHITIEKGNDTSTWKGGKPGDGFASVSSNASNSSFNGSLPLLSPPPP